MMKLDARISVSDLEAQAHLLDLQIQKLDRRGAHITPTEQVQSHQLKVARLVTKDRLRELRRT